MNPEKMKNRTKKFAQKIIELCRLLPNTREGRLIGDQIFRSGTSTASNYRAACRARSKAEFIAKLGIVEEEADESAFWMELIVEGGLMKEEMVFDLRKEAEELTAIMASSRISAYRNRKSKIANRK